MKKKCGSSNPLPGLTGLNLFMFCFNGNGADFSFSANNSH